MMTSTTNLIRLQSYLKEHVKDKYAFRNTRNGTRIRTKEMTDYSAMKFYLQENNFHCVTFSPDSEKPLRAVIRHLPPDTPTEDFSDGLEYLGFNVINMRQMTATRKAANGKTHVETLTLFLVTLTKRKKNITSLGDIQAE
jgi:hypothetical protein